MRLIETKTRKDTYMEIMKQLLGLFRKPKEGQKEQFVRLQNEIRDELGSKHGGGVTLFGSDIYDAPVVHGEDYVSARLAQLDARIANLCRASNERYAAGKREIASIEKLFEQLPEDKKIALQKEFEGLLIIARRYRDEDADLEDLNEAKKRMEKLLL